MDQSCHWRSPGRDGRRVVRQRRGQLRLCGSLLRDGHAQGEASCGEGAAAGEAIETWSERGRERGGKCELVAICRREQNKLVHFSVHVSSSRNRILSRSRYSRLFI